MNFVLDKCFGLESIEVFLIFRSASLYGFNFFDVISLCMICMRRSGDLYCLGNE